MTYGGRFIRAVMMVSAIGLTMGAEGVAKAAAVDSHSGDGLTQATVVLRGSAPDSARPSPVADGAPAVLRGSPAKGPQAPTAGYACPPGYDSDPNYGCVARGYADAPDDYGYGYWPYWGFDGFYSGGKRHRFDRNFLHSAGRGPAIRFGRLSAGGGVGHGLPHAGGFSHR
jgi:hypothetical protein